MVDEKSGVPVTLLYVEDEPVTRALVTGMLAPFGMTIYQADNGRDGLDMYKRVRPDIVVSDVLMPLMTGLEMAREIRADNPLAQIIIVSAHSDSEFLLEAIEIGIKHFVLKPLEMNKLVAVINDCIVFVKMQRLINQQHDKIRMLYDAIEQNSDITVIVDIAGTIEYVNKSFCQVTGYQLEAVVGKTPRVLNSGENHASLYQQLWADITGGKVWRGEMLNRKKNGEVYWEEMTISPVKNNDGEIVKYIKIATDVTERKKLVQEVQNARKLESIAIFAGGIAHDFNNLLQIITCNLFIIQSDFAADSKLVALASDAYAAAVRTEELNIKLLEFARQNKPVTETTHFHKLIADAATLFLRKPDITIDNMLPGDLWPVIADRVQMGQVVTNLLINAQEAMPAGGTVSIRADNLVLQRSDELSLQTGLYVLVSVADQGVGIPEENLPRVFDPYYSTKTLANRKGNGLGLAICHTVVKNHGGLIRIESVAGKGTTVFVYLPADLRHVAAENSIEMFPTDHTMDSARLAAALIERVGRLS